MAHRPISPVAPRLRNSDGTYVPEAPRQVSGVPISSDYEQMLRQETQKRVDAAIRHVYDELAKTLDGRAAVLDAATETVNAWNASFPDEPARPASYRDHDWD